MIRKEMIAKRYAKAFFEISAKGELAENCDKMSSIVDIINRNPSVLKFLVNPGIPSFKKKDIVKKLGATENLLSFILLLIEKGHLKLFPLILTFFNKLLDKEKKRVRVILTSAFLPSHDLKNALVEKLKKILKMDIILDIKIEPEIIGGGIIEIGSKRIDGSINSYLKSYLKRMGKYEG